MEDRKYIYTICVEDDDDVASTTSLDVAQILVSALFEKWSEEPRLNISIKRKKEDFTIEEK